MTLFATGGSGYRFPHSRVFTLLFSPHYSVAFIQSLLLHLWSVVVA